VNGAYKNTQWVKSLRNANARAEDPNRPGTYRRALANSQEYKPKNQASCVNSVTVS
jgi:hypothetical protein